MSKARKQSLTRALSRGSKGREAIVTTEVKGYIHFKELVLDERSGKKRFVNFFTKEKEIITPAGQVIKEAKQPRIMSEFIETFSKVFIMKKSRTGHNRAKTKFRKSHPKANYYIAQSV